MFVFVCSVVLLACDSVFWFVCIDKTLLPTLIALPIFCYVCLFCEFCAFRLAVFALSCACFNRFVVISQNGETTSLSFRGEAKSFHTNKDFSPMAQNDNTKEKDLRNEINSNFTYTTQESKGIRELRNDLKEVLSS